jgi:hypothetical protein
LHPLAPVSESIKLIPGKLDDVPDALILISDVELPVDFTIIVFINESRALFILIVAEFVTELLPIVAPYIPVKRLFVLSHVKFPLLVKVDAPEKYGILFAVPLPPILPLNVLQSVLLNAPLFVALAVGRLNVCVDVADEILKSVPVVPVANVCVVAVNPFSDVIPVPPVAFNVLPENDKFVPSVTLVTSPVDVRPISVAELDADEPVTVNTPRTDVLPLSATVKLSVPPESLTDNPVVPEVRPEPFT